MQYIRPTETLTYSLLVLTSFFELAFRKLCSVPRGVEGVREEVINQKILDFIIISELSVFNHSLYRSYKHFCENVSYGC